VKRLKEGSKESNNITGILREEERAMSVTGYVGLLSLKVNGDEILTGKGEEGDRGNTYYQP